MVTTDWEVGVTGNRFAEGEITEQDRKITIEYTDLGEHDRKVHRYVSLRFTFKYGDAIFGEIMEDRDVILKNDGSVILEEPERPAIDVGFVSGSSVADAAENLFQKIDHDYLITERYDDIKEDALP
jgi:hypothetical protein